MGLSSLPTPAEGIATTLMISTTQSISIAKEILRSVLQAVRFRQNPPETGSDDSTGEAGPSQLDLFPSFDEDFRYRVPAVLFKSIFDGCSSDLECSVCLSKFEPDAEINKLNCGHFFHKICLEKWFDYWHTTCPLCRSRLVSADQGCLTDQ